jgi:hypothetical protein
MFFELVKRQPPMHLRETLNLAFYCSLFNPG